MNSVRWPLALLASLMTATVASAQTAHDFQFVSQTVEARNTEIAQLKARLASLEATEVAVGGPAQTDGCGKCGKGGRGGYCWCSPCAGYIADAELLMLRAMDSNDDFHQDAVHSGSRYAFGYMDDCGRSLRARWFEYAASDGVVGGDSIQIEMIDLEYAGRFTIGCGWNGEISGGARWASIDIDDGGGPGDTILDDGLGPVLGLSVRNGLTQSVDLYISGRQSLVFGREVTATGPGTAAYNNIAITELAIGTEVSRAVAGTILSLRSGVEAQYYHSLIDGESDLGLVGYTVALGVSR